VRLWFSAASEVPIYRQLVTQVELAIPSGDAADAVFHRGWEDAESLVRSGAEQDRVHRAPAAEADWRAADGRPSAAAVSGRGPDEQDANPVLGTGKMELRGIKALAISLAAEVEA
jgi:hypothetical protein